MKSWITQFVILIALPLAGCDYAAMDSRDTQPSAMLTPAPAEAQSGGGRAGSPSALTLDATTDPAQTQRLVIYNAGLGMVVPDIAATLATIRQTAADSGGYLQEIDGQSIAIRVPADRFSSTLAAIEKLGEVTQRHIKAQDITEEMHDLKIRLENAEQIRQQLLALIAKSDKMEDTLKIESELLRVSEQMELLKGKIQFLSTQAAFSTIRVDLNSPLPQKQMIAQIPFAWIRNLGDGLVAGVAESDPDTSRWRARNVRFTLPGGYIRYYERDQLTEAMSANGMLIKLQRQDNYDGGQPDFWAALARRAMVENRAIAVTQQYDLKLNTQAGARVLLGTKDIGGKPSGYLVALITTKRYVYTFEAWGPADQFNQDRPALEQAVRSLEINP